MEKFIALTFDDGPNTVTTPQVLDVLEKEKVPGSFFLVGNNITDESAEVVRRAVKMGCEIENHSRTHSDMTQLSPEEIISEINFTSDKIEKITGVHPRFFRPPYIAYNQTMLENIDLTFICGFGAEDYNEHISPEERYKRVIDQSANGAVILLHDMEGNFRTVQALRKIIPELKRRGYALVTVSDLFEKCGVSPKRGVLYNNVFNPWK